MPKDNEGLQELLGYDLADKIYSAFHKDKKCEGKCNWDNFQELTKQALQQQKQKIEGRIKSLMVEPLPELEGDDAYDALERNKLLQNLLNFLKELK